MSFKIVADSCCDITPQIKEIENFVSVPLTLQIGDYKILDDSNFNQYDFISRMKEYSGYAQSACPSPMAWAEAFAGEEDEIYAITITDKLSGTYNSALQGKALFEEENPAKKKIHIFNSLATSGLETLIALKINSLKKSGKDFESVVSEVEDFILNQTELYFCLESFDSLRKNGRLGSLAATILKKLRVRLICNRTQAGSIGISGQDLNSNRAILKMINIIKQSVEGCDLSDKMIIISHVCCEEKAKDVAEKISASCNFGCVEVIRASGLNSLYASDGGIIVSFSK